MKFNLAQLLKESVGAVRQFDLAEPPYTIDPNLEAVEPMTGLVRVTRTNRGVLADIRLSTRVRQQCSRCLEDVVSPLSGRLTDEFFPTVDMRTGKSAKAPEESSGFMLTEAHELDLTEPVRQWALVEQPMKPLCRTDCRGLCPICGQNLNDRACRCAPAPTDARLSPLAEWLKVHKSN